MGQMGQDISTGPEAHAYVLFKYCDRGTRLHSHTIPPTSELLISSTILNQNSFSTKRKAEISELKEKNDRIVCIDREG